LFGGGGVEDGEGEDDFVGEFDGAVAGGGDVGAGGDGEGVGTVELAAGVGGGVGAEEAGAVAGVGDGVEEAEAGEGEGGAADGGEEDAAGPQVGQEVMTAVLAAGSSQDWLPGRMRMAAVAGSKLSRVRSGVARRPPMEVTGPAATATVLTR
jgi:hypothetical protein